MKKNKRRLLVRTGVLLAVLFAAFLASGVILAQSSQDFDLGCRAELTAGGSWTPYPNAGVNLHSSLGQWNAGRSVVQGSGIIVQSGYMLSASGQTFAAAPASAQSALGDNGAPADAPDGAQIVVDGAYLPMVYAVKFIRYVRPCNWATASAAAVPSVD